MSGLNRAGPSTQIKPLQPMAIPPGGGEGVGGGNPELSDHYRSYLIGWTTLGFGIYCALPCKPCLLLLKQNSDLTSVLFTFKIWGGTRV